MNLKVRAKNPWFWIGIAGVIFTAMGVNVQMLTSWDKVADAFVSLVENPFLLGSVVLAVLSVFVDPTTAGFKDSKQALTYDSPKKEEQ